MRDLAKQREYQRLWIAKRRSDWLADKACVICGSTERLEVDHIDPSLKVSNSVWSWSQVRRDAELAKCQVLCFNHHREKSGLERRRECPPEHVRRVDRDRASRCQTCHQARKRERRASA